MVPHPTPTIGPRSGARPDRGRRSITAVIVALVAIAALLVGLTLAPSSVAAEATTGDGPDASETTGRWTRGRETTGSGAEAEAGDAAADAAAEAEALLLQEGQQVYSQICSSCHQPGGTGLEGQFPPLIDNPNVDDAGYVADVITNGRQGEIVVDGVAYDGVMPSFSTLTDEEVEAVTAYIQNDFQAPPTADGEQAIGSGGPVAGTELPALTNMGSLVAFLLAALVVLLVLAPRLLSVNDRLAVPWLDAWLKTAAIVVAVYLLVIHIPNWALQQGSVGRLSRFGQDLIGTGLWSLGVAVLLGGLWYAHRESRV